MRVSGADFGYRIAETSAGWAWIAYDRGGDPVEQGLAPSRAVAAACVIRVFARSHAPRSPDAAPRRLAG
ncbi:hypothetical protein [Phenylobacterium zucineum]|uniref:hypothetical protein n=1 Tax=Phenylobacterium zucineum TaxID=284016 RepID=UPI0002DB4E1F|nr:hypothetical protein [Phenylobacterium zucineum]